MMKPNKQALEELKVELKEYESKQNKLWKFCRNLTPNSKMSQAQIDGMNVQLAGFNTLTIALKMRIADLEKQVTEDES